MVLVFLRKYCSLVSNALFQVFPVLMSLAVWFTSLALTFKMARRFPNGITALGKAFLLAWPPGIPVQFLSSSILAPITFHHNFISSLMMLSVLSFP
jgi:hypothetical protein